MIEILIYAITLIGVLLCLVSIEHKTPPLTKTFHAVYCAYQNLIQGTSRMGMVLIKAAIGIAVFLAGLLSYDRSQRELNQAGLLKMVILVCCIEVILIISLYFLFGIPLLIFSKIENLITTIHKRKLCFRFLITSYILFVYSFFLWYAPEEMAKNGTIVFIGLFISYIMNMEMLINISMEPLTCRLSMGERVCRIEQKYPLKIILAGALILIFLIVLNLYLGVVLIADFYDQAYICVGTGKAVTYFDLLYYTVISFTTIGYGEIVPQRLESKLMAIVIAYTSVMCLVIFVSSILALKDKLHG